MTNPGSLHDSLDISLGMAPKLENNREKRKAEGRMEKRGETGRNNIS